LKKKNGGRAIKIFEICGDDGLVYTLRPNFQVNPRDTIELSFSAGPICYNISIEPWSIRRYCEPMSRNSAKQFLKACKLLAAETMN